MIDKKRPASLFVGRWQPFHQGHKRLIETVLKTGKPVVIAIRDTEQSISNPYTTSERRSVIKYYLKEYGELVKIVVIPDIDEICYGRDVGYGIREIKLPSDIEKISGTKIRSRLNTRPKPVIWLTGQSGSGKTSIAQMLKKRIGGIMLDGDDMRQSVSNDLGFSKNDRITHNIRIAKLAKVLAQDTQIIVSLITPFEDLRVIVSGIINPVWVYVERNLEMLENRPFEVPFHYHVKVNSDKQTVEEQVETIIKYLKKH